MNKVLLLFLLPQIPLAFADTYTDIDIVNNYTNINITTAITAYELQANEDGFATRLTSLDELREYQFDRTSSDTPYDIHWDSLDTEKIQFTINDTINDARGNVTGSLLGSVELDDVSSLWIYNTKNIINVLSALKVEYFFSAIADGGDDDETTTSSWSSVCEQNQQNQRNGTTLLGVITVVYAAVIVFVGIREFG